MGQKKNILIIVNTDWFFLLHRVQIAKALRSEIYTVTVAAKNTGKKQQINKLGFDFVDVNFFRKGLNPFLEMTTFVQLYKLIKIQNPCLIYQVTIKPIIYGSIIAKVLNVKTVNTVCGLGHVFSKKENNLLRKIVSIAYKNVVNYKNSHTFFENSDNQSTFLRLGILKKKSQSTVVNGAGVDLNKFRPIENLNSDKKLVITLATRMLWDKGVKEFVAAARLLHKKFEGKVEFCLYGMIDKGNPESVPEDYLNNIEINDYLKWFGFERDMVCVYKKSDIVVLPSYYGEGLPTVLAEACAMGLSIVTTNSVGCKECVDDGVNGYMIPIKSSVELAGAIEKLILNKDLRLKMGKASREKAIKKFDQRKIVDQYLQVFNSMLLN